MNFERSSDTLEGENFRVKFSEIKENNQDLVYDINRNSKFSITNIITKSLTGIDTPATTHVHGAPSRHDFKPIFTNPVVEVNKYQIKQNKEFIKTQIRAIDNKIDTQNQRIFNNTKGTFHSIRRDSQEKVTLFGNYPQNQEKPKFQNEVPKFQKQIVNFQHSQQNIKNPWQDLHVDPQKLPHLSTMQNFYNQNLFNSQNFNRQNFEQLQSKKNIKRSATNMNFSRNKLRANNFYSEYAPPQQQKTKIFIKTGQNQAKPIRLVKKMPGAPSIEKTVDNNSGSKKQHHHSCEKLIHIFTDVSKKYVVNPAKVEVKINKEDIDNSKLAIISSKYQQKLIDNKEYRPINLKKILYSKY